MIKNPPTMKSASRLRQQEPVWILGILFFFTVVFFPVHPLPARDTEPAAICSFAIALPEMEGPLTLGIFSQEGELVRLLYKDAPVDSVPAGLNGLLISWDGKDDSGVAVPPGIYHGRGLVHGSLNISALPREDPNFQPTHLYETDDADAVSHALPAFPLNRITIMAARDALLQERPPLAITAQLHGNLVVVAAEGLPLFAIPVGSGVGKPALELHVIPADGNGEGMAELTLIFSKGSESYTISGLDRLVPLDAGSLEMPPHTFLSPHDAAGDGVSHP